MRIDMNKFDLSKSQIDFLIEEWIFNSRNREILRDRLFDGLTFEQLAEKHGLSVRQTKNIVYKSMEKLISRL